MASKYELIANFTARFSNGELGCGFCDFRIADEIENEINSIFKAKEKAIELFEDNVLKRHDNISGFTIENITINEIPDAVRRLEIAVAKNKLSIDSSMLVRRYYYEKEEIEQSAPLITLTTREDN